VRYINLLVVVVVAYTDRRVLLEVARIRLGPPSNLVFKLTLTVETLHTCRENRVILFAVVLSQYTNVKPTDDRLSTSRRTTDLYNKHAVQYFLG